MKIETGYGDSTHCILSDDWEELANPLIEKGQRILKENKDAFCISYRLRLGEFYQYESEFRTDAHRLLVYENGAYYSADEKWNGQTQEIPLP